MEVNNPVAAANDEDANDIAAARAAATTVFEEERRFLALVDLEIKAEPQINTGAKIWQVSPGKLTLYRDSKDQLYLHASCFFCN